MNSVKVSIESPLSADADILIQGSEYALREVYAPDECFSFTAAQLDKPSIVFLVARNNDVPVGCVASVDYGNYKEVKRLYVSPEARGLGVAKLLMDKLEENAITDGISIIRLETGEKLAAAVVLYKSRGYIVCEKFGEYEDHPASLFMEKVIA